MLESQAENLNCENILGFAREMDPHCIPDNIERSIPSYYLQEMANRTTNNTVRYCCLFNLKGYFNELLEQNRVLDIVRSLKYTYAGSISNIGFNSIGWVSEQYNKLLSTGLVGDLEQAYEISSLLSTENNGRRIIGDEQYDSININGPSFSDEWESQRVQIGVEYISKVNELISTSRLVELEEVQAMLRRAFTMLEDKDISRALGSKRVKAFVKRGISSLGKNGLTSEAYANGSRIGLSERRVNGIIGSKISFIDRLIIAIKNI